jgi:hypothetical protein
MIQLAIQRYERLRCSMVITPGTGVGAANIQESTKDCHYLPIFWRVVKIMSVLVKEKMKSVNSS